MLDRRRRYAIFIGLGALALVTAAWLAFGVLFPGRRRFFSPEGGVNVPVTGERSARRAFAEYIRLKHPYGIVDPGDYELTLECYRDLAWLVRAEYRRFAGHGVESYIADGSGFRPANLGNICCLMQRAFPGDLSEAERKALVEETIRLHTSADGFDPASIVGSVEDIPGYGQARGNSGGRLDADLESVVRPPWSFVDEGSGSLVVVVCTYRKLGGGVSRYRFRFGGSSGGESREAWRFLYADKLLLGREVGAFDLID